jgi:hypothetical protein
MTKPISTLRRHMIEDMKMRNMSPNNQKVYLDAYQPSQFHGQFMQFLRRLGTCVIGRDPTGACDSGVERDHVAPEERAEPFVVDWVVLSGVAVQ